MIVLLPVLQILISVNHGRVQMFCVENISFLIHGHCSSAPGLKLLEKFKNRDSCPRAEWHEIDFTGLRFHIQMQLLLLTSCFNLADPVDSSLTNVLRIQNPSLIGSFS